MGEIGGALDLGIARLGPAEADVFARAMAANTTESCGTSAMRERTSTGSADLTGTPSSEIVPACGS